MELSQEMKGLLKELGMALHRALTRDEDIKSITEQIRGEGYDIYLIMEANIALDRREENEEGRLFLHSPEEQAEMDSVRYNKYDLDFLEGLKIQVDDKS